MPALKVKGKSDIRAKKKKIYIYIYSDSRSNRPESGYFIGHCTPLKKKLTNKYKQCHELFFHKLVLTDKLMNYLALKESHNNNSFFGNIINYSINILQIDLLEVSFLNYILLFHDFIYTKQADSNNNKNYGLV